MWRKYFKLKGLVPGKVVVPVHGTIDFSGTVPVETCKELYEDDWPFLDITDEGKQVLYGIETQAKPPVKKPSRKRTSRNKTDKPE